MPNPDKVLTFRQNFTRKSPQTCYFPPGFALFTSIPIQKWISPVFLFFQWRPTGLILSRPGTLSGYNPLLLDQKHFSVSGHMIGQNDHCFTQQHHHCETMINLLSDIKSSRQVRCSIEGESQKSLNKAIGQHIQHTNRLPQRMHLIIKVFCLLIYTVVASTCLKNDMLTALVCQYSDI